ncbi:MAG: aminotransferase class I/II-fold pyridoxal phosphate-dependent enzyme [Bacillota bacterium]|nr:aminotransferase class I/II-fold pyridoxal phosphate-dependent enzyme [Bacillota bacterium]
MLYFMNDYSEGAHPKILEALSKTNMEQHVGYGVDTYTNQAKSLIKNRISRQDVDVHLMVTGTLTNLVSISHCLRPYEAIISTRLGHIAVHETGAIEATGHKVIEMPSEDGILKPEQIDEAVAAHLDEHMVVPKLVYISNATEMGTIYTKNQLIKLREKCDEHGLYLYLDGARLATALTCSDNDLTIEEIAKLTDIFYIGGTKNGILFGEALVVSNPELKDFVRFSIKQRGGLLAKGRILGLQFIELFTDDLYFEIAKHTNEMAKLLTDGINKLGYKLVTKTSTNLIFTVLPNAVHDELSKVCNYEAEVPHDENSIEARFVTSWATPKEDVLKLLELLKKLKY